MTVVPTINLTQADIGNMGPENTKAAREDVPKLHERLNRIDSLLRAREAFHRDDSYFVLVREGEQYYVLGATSEYEVDWPPCIVSVRKSDVRVDMDVVDVEISGVIHHLTPGGPSLTFTLVCKGSSPQLFELQAFRTRAEAMTALSQSIPDSFDTKDVTPEVSAPKDGDGDLDATAVRPPSDASAKPQEAILTVPAQSSDHPPVKVPSSPPVPSGLAASASSQSAAPASKPSST